MSLVSVIIPSFNRKQDVVLAVDSVLSQTYPHVEVIVVDDASSDGTYEWLRKHYPQVKLIRNETGKGGAVARNQGAEAASGEYVAFLDSDDLWLPEHLEKKIAKWTPAVDGMYCAFINQDSAGSRTTVKFDSQGLRKGNLGSMVLGNQRFDARTSTFIFRKDAFLKVMFDPKMRKHQDWDLAIQFDQVFNFVFVDEASVVINLGTTTGRMSGKLNHEASLYFLNKNVGLVNANSIFLFCLKMAYRCELFGEPPSAKRHYINFCKRVTGKLSMKMKVIYYLVSLGILSPSFFYRLKRAVAKTG
jgi:glycosyltransferase involved in cell wall biosynthesis